MNVSKTELDGVLLITPTVHTDERGRFYESFNQAKFCELVSSQAFVQDNQSMSVETVLRGLHYQYPNGQGKLVRVSYGKVYDVVVDLRRDSKTFGKWIHRYLSAANFEQLWIPPGCAHGFLNLDGISVFQYKTTEYYYPENEHTIRWDDPILGIAWPLDGDVPILSQKDSAAPFLTELPQLEVI